MGFIFPLFIALMIALVVFGVMQSARRKKELRAWAAGRGLTYREAKDRSFDERFPDFSDLFQGSNRYAYNICEGAWRGRPALAFDYHYETHSHSSKGGRRTHHHHFSAVVLGSGVFLKPLQIRPEGIFDKLGAFFGFDDIDFESAEFSRRFHVSSPDRRWAYDVLHARAIQFLLDMPRRRIVFAHDAVYASNGSRMTPAEMEASLELAAGLLDRLPEYVLKQAREETHV